LIRMYRDDPVPIYTELFAKHSMFDFLRGVGVLSETLYLHAFDPYCFRCVKIFAESRCCTTCNVGSCNDTATTTATTTTTTVSAATAIPDTTVATTSGDVSSCSL
jgi:hypothetical protein